MDLGGVGDIQGEAGVLVEHVESVELKLFEFLDVGDVVLLDEFLAPGSVVLDLLDDLLDILKDLANHQTPRTFVLEDKNESLDVGGDLDQGFEVLEVFLFVVFLGRFHKVLEIFSLECILILPSTNHFTHLVQVYSFQ